MQDQNQNQTDDNDVRAANDAAARAASDDAATNTADDAAPADAPAQPSGVPERVMADVRAKIGEANNILVALSSDPTVDDLAAAIGLSLFLERAGKRAVAIYSGRTPNAMEFLNPADTLKPTADTLQDFVIAISKDKADHLRYKLDGDYVKIFITPYRTRIAEDDLEFSYGDFNIDLVVAINVSNESELDNALREQGRVLHDATVVNITTGEPGSFGKVEWSDPTSSSVSEMIANLIYGMGDNAAVEKDDATALLTGIIAATNRFSEVNTSPETMQVASKLMSSGADQKLITENITADLKDKILELADNVKKAENATPAEEQSGDEGVLMIDKTEPAAAEKPAAEAVEAPTTEAAKEPVAEAAPATSETTAPEVATPAAEATPATEATTESVAPATEEALAPATETPTAETAPTTEAAPTAEDSSEPSAPAMIWPTDNPSSETSTGSADSSLPTVQTPLGALGLAPDVTTVNEVKSETVVAPSSDFAEEMKANDPGKYGQMLTDALAELDSTPATSGPAAPAMPAVSDSAVATPDISNPAMPTAPAINNPAMSAAPAVAAAPEINGVPEINYASMPGDSILPPAPAPNIDMSGMPPSLDSSVLPPAAPAAPAAPVAPTPQQPASPSDFKIPGM